MSMFRGFQYIVLSIAAIGANANADKKFDFSGFVRIVGGMLDTDQAEFKGYTDDLDLRADSLIGLQAEYQLLNSLDVTGQIVGRADANNDSGLEWFYLTWKPFNSLQVKAGNLRTPFFTFSDYTDVGYAYHWVSPPTQVYNAYLYRKYDGVDITWTYAADSFDFNLEAYAGESYGEVNVGPNSVKYNTSNLLGVIGSVSIKNFQLRASRYQGDAVIGLPQLESLASILSQAGFQASADSLSTEGSGAANQIGVSYNNLKYFVYSEWVKIEADYGVAPKLESYYLSSGYYFDPLTLHLTYANSTSEPSEPVDEIPIGLSPELDQLAQSYQQVVNSFGIDNLSSWTVGLRWDVQPNLALKADLTILQGEPGQTSFFNNIDTGFDRNANLYQFSVDWVF